MIALTFTTGSVNLPAYPLGNGIETPTTVTWGKTRSGTLYRYQTSDWLYTLTFEITMCPAATFNTYLALYQAAPEDTVLTFQDYKFTGSIIEPTISLTYDRCGNVDFVLRFKGTREAV